MAHWTYEQEVLCLTGKAGLFGAAIPVWTYWLDGILIDTGHFALGKGFQPLLRELQIDRVLIQEKATKLHTRGRPAKRIGATLFPTKRFVEFLSRGEWSRENLVQSLL